jgi:protoporphyrinogen oxidase
MNFWLNILPMEQIGTPADPLKTDKVMLLRHRLSRILFMRKFFDYPISLTLKTIKNLGLVRIFKIGLSYMKAQTFKIKEEKSLEDFLINRFGKELYNTFFRDYTKKVWGVPCDKIKPEWGAQRIKGLSITKAIIHAIKAIIKKDSSIGQKEVETSLISQFLYPKFGPGQLWETVADIIKSKGGEIYLNHKTVGINFRDNKISSVKIKNEQTGEQKEIAADYVFSTMAVKDLVEAMGQAVPENVSQTASGLCYRDFITVGLLVKKLKIKNDTDIKTVNNIVPDNWIYIQEPDVKIGRLQIFNNWSPYMVADKNNVWLGLEYFCNNDDELWDTPDEKFKTFAAGELAKIGIINSADVLDSVVIRVEKTYPAYFGSYDQFDIIKNYTDTFENLFLIGRNGMHRYNNQDHSMLTAMTAVENIVSGITTKENIWQVNSEEEYHEEKNNQ